jgi:protocatechuate 3,4-dioxygenase beta subunit
MTTTSISVTSIPVATPIQTALTRDLNQMLQAPAHRRSALRWLGLAGLPLGLQACGGGGDSAAAATTTTPTTTGGSSSCSVIPSETAGPYPGDGTNGANALTLSGIVRSTITSSLGSASGVAAGVPLTVKLRIVNTAASCAALAGRAVYLWHADALGRYSMYSSGVTAENYLRGVQETDSDGWVSFTTIVPGCYDGRYPHMHFEVFPSLAVATSGNNDVKTSQLTFPTDLLTAVYATGTYVGSTANFAKVTLGTDNVFSDGSTLQVSSATGSVSAGYVATLTVGI